LLLKNQIILLPNITIAKIVVILTDIGVIKDLLLVSLGLPDPIKDSTIFSLISSQRIIKKAN